MAWISYDRIVLSAAIPVHVKGIVFPRHEEATLSVFVCFPEGTLSNLAARAATNAGLIWVVVGHGSGERPDPPEKESRKGRGLEMTTL